MTRATGAKMKNVFYKYLADTHSPNIKIVNVNLKKKKKKPK